MAAPAPEPGDPARLLLDLEQRVLEDPVLCAEWDDAFAGFAHGRHDPGLRDRFREWFLLERPSQALGAPPVVYWAPQSYDPDGAWARLLDSFLGAFRCSAAAMEGEMALEDLWSGRTILVRAPGAESWPDEDTLAVGRFVLGDDVYHEPLPGLLVVRAPGLVSALERDLAASRARNPRARLSQAEAERLFAPFLPAAPEAERAALEARLHALLSGQSLWTLPRVAEALRVQGAGEVLNQLAFDTDLDLEELRRLLPEYERLLADQAGDPGAEPAAGSGAEVPANRPTAAAALARFDAGKAQGQSLDQLFRDLESDLGLPEDSTREGDPDAGFETPVYVPDFGSWVDAYAWERKSTGEALTAGEEQVLREFTQFVRDAAPEGLDIRALSPRYGISFLLKAGAEGRLLQARAALEPFLAWAAREQEAPLQDFLEELRGPLAERLERWVACNQELAAAGRPATARARVVSSKPARVAAGSAGGEDSAEVVGLPDSCAAALRPGDSLLGSWHDGRFHPSAILPREVFADAAGDSPD
ncbi:MAG: hypothetical protein EYC70_03540 [Planctomycetota bacterium]|nr:MAG: hypothetical protein EYC70_03540 [Planctomycetota bacterium]